MITRVRVQTELFDSTREGNNLRAMSSATGALVEFTGLVRDLSEGQSVSAMYLEHYPGMTEKSLEKIAASAQARWQLIGVSIIHRVGRLGATEPIVYVAVTSEHRKDAFEACQYVMDFLKTKAPFWKKEWGEGDDAAWVAAKESDDKAAERW